MRRGALLVLISGLCAACVEPPGAPAGTVVVGITSDFRPGPDVVRLVAEMRVDGAPEGSREWAVGGAEALSFPMELSLSHLPDGARVDVSLLAYGGVPLSERPFLRRDVATSIVGQRTLLLRAHLEWECVPGFHLPGEALAPTCEGPRTCVAAACQDPYVPPEELEAYSPLWAVAFADECRPAGAGAPEVEIGRGRESFDAVAPFDPVIMERDPRGGFHVWLALRAKNLHRRGSVTTLAVRREDSGEELCSAEVPWDFAPSGAGACDLAGIRCLVTHDPHGMQALAGDRAVVSVKVVDLLGNMALAEEVVTLSAPP